MSYCALMYQYAESDGCLSVNFIFRLFRDMFSAKVVLGLLSSVSSEKSFNRIMKNSNSERASAIRSTLSFSAIGDRQIDQEQQNKACIMQTDWVRTKACIRLSECHEYTRGMKVLYKKYDPSSVVQLSSVLGPKC